MKIKMISIDIKFQFQWDFKWRWQFYVCKDNLFVRMNGTRSSYIGHCTWCIFKCPLSRSLFHLVEPVHRVHLLIQFLRFMDKFMPKQYKIIEHKLQHCSIFFFMFHCLQKSFVKTFSYIRPKKKPTAEHYTVCMLQCRKWHIWVFASRNALLNFIWMIWSSLGFFSHLLRMPFQQVAIIVQKCLVNYLTN